MRKARQSAGFFCAVGGTTLAPDSGSCGLPWPRQ
nr:MAG TPA: hypothetical protein [Caudoviricetes sp.]